MADLIDITGNMSVNRALGSLSTEEVAFLMGVLKYNVYREFFLKNEIDGPALICIETIKDLDDLENLENSALKGIPTPKKNAFLHKLNELKKDGVCQELLSASMSTSGASMSVASMSTSANALSRITNSALPSNKCSVLYSVIREILHVSITFLGAIQEVLDHLSSNGRIGDLNADNFQVSSGYALDHGNQWRSNNPLMGTTLTGCEIASIGLYTMEGPFYSTLNIILREGDANAIRPFAKFLLLLNRALLKCPKPSTTVVFRAFKDDVTAQYRPGIEYTWEQLSSSTTDISITQSFLSTNSATGAMQGTLFTIEIRDEHDCARCIDDYSLIKGEKEVIICPGTRFAVIGCISNNGFHMIQISTVSSNECILHIESTLASTSASMSTSMLTSMSTSMSTSASTSMLTSMSTSMSASEYTKEFTFESLGDNKGLFYYIGTAKRTRMYCNPHGNGVIADRSSNGMSGGGEVKYLVGRGFGINITANTPNSWMKVDLLGHRSFIITSFSLGYGYTNTFKGIHFLQNFELQGSNDDTNWETIQRYENDTFGNACEVPKGFAEENRPRAHWYVDQICETGYRYFRILQFGQHQGGKYHVLSLSEFEIYGRLKEI